MAKQATFVQHGKNIDYTATADITYGDMVPLVTRVGVALETIPNGCTGSVTVAGTFECAAETGVAFAVGDQLYWDATNKRLTKTAASNTPAGWATEVKASAGTTARVKIG